MSTQTTCCGFARNVGGQNLGLCVTCARLGPRATALLETPAPDALGVWACGAWVALKASA